MFKTRRAREVPSVSTAALPDIVFMLLFFFMVTSTMRTHTPKMTVKLPNAQTVTKQENKDAICYIYIGEQGGTDGTGTMAVQVNDQLVDIKQVAALVMAERAKLPKYKQDKFSVALKIHRDAKMKLVKQVKEQLKQAGALQIDYSGTHTGI